MKRLAAFTNSNLKIGNGHLVRLSQILSCLDKSYFEIDFYCDYDITPSWFNQIEHIKTDVENFFRTAKLSIKYREFAKFKFTKAINAIFENLIKLGHEINIPREDMEYIEIKTILSCYSNLSTTKLKTILEKEIR